MPTITRTFIKTALAYLVGGTLLSALWLLNLAWPLHPLLSYLQPTALHLIVVGWLTQLIFGVAIWMFPPWSRAQPRGPDRLSWLCYALLNGGLVLRLSAEPLTAYRPSAATSGVLLAAAAAQVVAAWIFVGLVWSRVRGKSGGR